ncbi:MAG: hypothetical protein IT376_18375 [Polyangiaceae bacterium]|nr:hypothetical protein [Polyangiaceae bacterium]
MLSRLTIAAVAAAAALAAACGDDSAGAGGGASGADGGGAGGGAGAGGGGAGGAGQPYEACSADGWCWYAPSPQGNDLRAAWGSSLSDVWAVGTHGTLLHHDGGGWRGLAAGTTSTLLAVHGAEGVVWAVGAEATVVRVAAGSAAATQLTIDGETLTDELRGVWSFGPEEVWAVGAGGLILRWDGSEWTRTNSPSAVALSGVWGSRRDDVWAVGASGTALRYDGATWKKVASGATATLTAVAGSGVDDVWVGTATGEVRRWNGAKWTTTKPSAYSIRALAVESAERAWVAGNDGRVHRWDGTEWSALASGTNEHLRGGFSPAGDEVFLVGDGGAMVFFRGDARSTELRGSAANRLALAGGGPELWAVGDEVVKLEAGGPRVVPSGTPRALYGAASAGAGDLWIAGTAGTVLRFDAASGIGGAFVSETVPSGAWLQGVWSLGGGEVWVVGSGGVLLHRSEGVWEKSSLGGRDFRAVWGPTPARAWAVGELGEVREYDGSAWTQVAVEPGTPKPDFRDVHGTGPDDVWVVGSLGSVYRWDGSAWTAAMKGEGHSFNGVFALAKDDVWAVGTGGVVRHWDGASWAPSDAGTGVSLNDVWARSADEVWVVGEGGAILRRVR